MGKPFALSRMRRFSPGQRHCGADAPPFGRSPMSASTSGRAIARRLRDLLSRRSVPSEEIEMSDAASTPWPTELRLHKDRKALTIAFDNGETFDLSAEYLRVRSPSAEVQGHSPDERKTVAGKKDVAILEVYPIGNYAVRLVFDDMHSTGICSWDYFLALGRNREAYWQEYLDDLAGKGLKRRRAPGKQGGCVAASDLPSSVPRRRRLPH